MAWTIDSSAAEAHKNMHINHICSAGMSHHPSVLFKEGVQLYSAPVACPHHEESPSRPKTLHLQGVLDNASNP